MPSTRRSSACDPAALLRLIVKREVREELRLMTVAMEAAQCGSARSGFSSRVSG